MFNNALSKRYLFFEKKVLSTSVVMLLVYKCFMTSKNYFENNTRSLENFLTSKKVNISG